MASVKKEIGDALMRCAHQKRYMFMSVGLPDAEKYCVVRKTDACRLELADACKSINEICPWADDVRKRAEFKDRLTGTLSMPTAKVRSVKI